MAEQFRVLLGTKSPLRNIVAYQTEPDDLHDYGRVEDPEYDSLLATMPPANDNEEGESIG